MEEIREEKISEILSWLQATARGKMARQTFQKLKAQKVLTCILPSFKLYLKLCKLNVGVGIAIFDFQIKSIVNHTCSQCLLRLELFASLQG